MMLAMSRSGDPSGAGAATVAPSSAQGRFSKSGASNRTRLTSSPFPGSVFRGMQRRMWTRIAFPLLAIAVAMLIAVTSVTSAGMMAPDRGEVAIEAFELAHGTSVGDLCGGELPHDHSCPLCHALPDAPGVGHDSISFLLTPHDGWRRLSDLHRAAQTRNLHHSPRGPPVTG
ncbi:hypothetical protein GCM10011341_05290 [Frigidibacter albus]|nr:hypothetical protein GCM10011341_05290 [Frigidibacter albus]